MPAGNKRSYILKKNLQLKTAGLFKYVCSYVILKYKRVKNLWKICPISISVSRTPKTSNMELFAILANA